MVHKIPQRNLETVEKCHETDMKGQELVKGQQNLLRNSRNGQETLGNS